MPSHSLVAIPTTSGTMKSEMFAPDGEGPFGAVILCIDGGGYRPALARIAERVSSMGYVVAVPDLFFRTGSPFDLLPSGAPRDMHAFLRMFADAELRQAFFTSYYTPALDYDHLREEIEPLLDELAKRSDFNGKVGTTGYCMGGNASLRIASLFGTRIHAAAVFHGGGLVTDKPDSPHLRVQNITAKVYVAGAIEDPSFPDEARATLIDAFEKAHVDATVETYPARHGFVVEDHGTYDAAAARRHDEALASFYGAHLA